MDRPDRMPNVPPFVKFVASAVPMVFDNSLSYYEALCALWKYIQGMTDVINNNATLEEEYIEKFNELKSFVDHYFDNLDVQEEINNKLDQMVEDGTFEELLENYLHKLSDYSNSNQITLGNNLITNTTLWLLNDGWTTDGAGTFTHIVGQTADLVYNYTFDANKVYIVDFQINTSYPAGSDNAGNDWTVTMGNTNPIITYRGGGSMHYTIALKPTTAGTLNFKCVKHNDPYTASGAFDGSISSISVKEATGNLQQLAIKDANDANSLAFSILLATNDSVAIGNGAGISNVAQTKNVYIGNESGRDDKTGYFNTGVGAATLSASVNSTRNTAVGYSALRNMESGDRNTALGTFAMSGNKYGRKNIAIGFDTMMSLQTGQDNMAIGNQALVGVTNVSNQLAIGPMAMGASTHTGDTANTAIGRVALYYNTTGSNNLAIGANALYKNTTGDNNIAIGNTVLSQAQTATDNIGIGNNAMGSGAVTGHNNVAIGSTNLYYNTTGAGNTAIGKGTLYKNTTGNNNIGIGSNAVSYCQTVSGLIGIGSNAGNKISAGGYSVIIGSDMSQSNLATMERSVAIGSVNVAKMTSLTNSTILGYNIQADDSHTALQNVIAINTGRRTMTLSKDNYINIANVIYANTFTVGREQVGIGVDNPSARLHLPASTVDGGSAPIKITAGTLMGSAENGAFEFDGTHLYFTIGSTRHTIV